MSEASRRLGVGVQRVHQRIADGSLPAQRVGSQWVIEEQAVSGLDRRGAGRPLSPASVWAVLVMAAAAHATGTEADKNGSAQMGPAQVGGAECGQTLSDAVRALTPTARFRARARLRDLAARARAAELGDAAAEETVAELAADLRLMFRRRADRVVYRVAPADLADLRADARVDLAGVSLPESGLASADLVEGYVADDELPDLVAEFLLVPVSPVSPSSSASTREGNVILHVRDSGRVPREVSRAVLVGGGLLLAVDLAEHRTPREQLKAAQVLRTVSKRVAQSVAASGRARKPDVDETGRVDGGA
ncbi:helix-turn-helix domain-containing protein [Dermatophilaceae bacterium Soc4.6]